MNIYEIVNEDAPCNKCKYFKNGNDQGSRKE